MPLLKSANKDSDRTHERSKSSSPTRKKSFFSKRRSSLSSQGNSNHNKPSSGMFGTGRSGKKMLDKDPSVINARQMVSEAEDAEKEARNRVKLAREHVRNLEQEALEEAKHAKAKQAEVKVITKTMKGLGRHGP